MCLSEFIHIVTANSNTVLYDEANMESFCIKCLHLKAYLYDVTENLYWN